MCVLRCHGGFNVEILYLHPFLSSFDWELAAEGVSIFMSSLASVFLYDVFSLFSVLSLSFCQSVQFLFALLAVSILFLFNIVVSKRGTTRVTFL